MYFLGLAYNFTHIFNDYYVTAVDDVLYIDDLNNIYDAEFLLL